MARRREVSADTALARKAQAVLVAEGGDSFGRWQEQIEGLEESGVSRLQAIIGASKDYPCLGKLLQESGLLGSENDPEPERAVCLNKPATFIENVRWAAQAAGEARMTGRLPLLVPNFAAWYLYEQAIKEPSKFTTLLNTAEGKASKIDVDDGDVVESSKKSIIELDRILLQIAQEQ